jgi:rfaE bifunctional protein nucleotidyltransferase chain/domain
MTSVKITTADAALQGIPSDATVVFTNGCFDILHPGHVDYLERAGALGTHLVVGVNSDASVRRIKGPTRPVNDEHSRSRVLAALGCVDRVVIFDEDTPWELIKKIRPQVLVKGGDWPVEQIVGRELVRERNGQVLSLPLLSGYSTTDIIRRVLDLHQKENGHE